MSKEQPARAANIAAIVDYYESGIKDKATKLGIELEHTLINADGSPLSYNDEYGQKWILSELRSDFPESMLDREGYVAGIFSDTGAVTLEPAAQVELSAGPFDDLARAERVFGDFERTLSDLVSPHGIDVLTPGYHPTMKAVDLELIPKTRYKYMNEYLGAVSMYGICMMRGSASTQVAIDYTSSEDCLRKMRLAYACVPIFSLICDNSPIFEAQTRPHQLVRTEIWNKCDPDRCGVVPGALDADFSLEAYAQYILDTPAIIDITSGKEVFSEKTFGEIYADKTMETSDIEHALSMFFNDVRLKTYIEIRPADAMPIAYVIAYTALIKGLFYNAGSLDAMDELFKGVTERDIAEAKLSLMQDGYAGCAYGHPVSEIADELISIAAIALSEEDRSRLEPLASLVSSRTTLASIALQDSTQL